MGKRPRNELAEPVDELESSQEEDRCAGEEAGNEDGSEDAQDAMGVADNAGSSSEEEQTTSDPGSDEDLGIGEDDEFNDGALEDDEGFDADAESEGGETSSSGGASDGDSDGEQPSTGQRGKAAGFMEGGKSASFAKAFAKIMSKTLKPEKSQQAAEAAAADPSEVILAESASIQKRKAEEAEEGSARREAKKRRLEMKQRGHLKVPKKGEDPVQDAFEKQLLRLATKGVVLLFNAVNTAQKQQAEAKAAGKKVRNATRAGLMAQLKASSQIGVSQTGLPQLGLNGQQQQQHKQRGQQQEEEEEEEEAYSDDQAAPGWEVLGDSIPGLTGGTKMKDWDKRMEMEDEEHGQEQVAGSDDDGDDDDGW